MDVWDLLLIVGVIGTAWVWRTQDRAYRQRGLSTARIVAVVLLVASIAGIAGIYLTPVPWWAVFVPTAGIVVLFFSPESIVRLGRWIDALREEGRGVDRERRAALLTRHVVQMAQN